MRRSGIGATHRVLVTGAKSAGSSYSALAEFMMRWLVNSELSVLVVRFREPIRESAQPPPMSESSLRETPNP
jgi:hypothetical protein